MLWKLYLYANFCVVSTRFHNNNRILLIIRLCDYLLFSFKWNDHAFHARATKKLGGSVLITCLVRLDKYICIIKELLTINTIFALYLLSERVKPITFLAQVCLDFFSKFWASTHQYQFLGIILRRGIPITTVLNFNCYIWNILSTQNLALIETEHVTQAKCTNLMNLESIFTNARFCLGDRFSFPPLPFTNFFFSSATASALMFLDIFFGKSFTNTLNFGPNLDLQSVCSKER